MDVLDDASDSTQRSESGLTEDTADNEHDVEKKKQKNFEVGDDLKTFIEDALLDMQTRFREKTEVISAMIDVMEGKVKALENNISEYRSELGDENPSPSISPSPASVPEKENTPSASGVKLKD